MDSPPQFTALVLDLFGTLVPAPSTRERALAVHEMASAMKVPENLVKVALKDSWLPRHDGTLRTTGEVAARLTATCGAPRGRAPHVEAVLRKLAPGRLQADTTVLQCLAKLRRSGLKLCLLSDAAPDIAEAWSRSALSSHFGVALFSCREQAVKPSRQLYAKALERLDRDPRSVLYCGDGGGAELAGAARCGLRAVRVERRGGPTALAFGAEPSAWRGVTLKSVEELPTWLAGLPVGARSFR